MTVADRIRDKRNEKGLSQLDLAKLIGTKDRSTISQIENSGDNVTMKNIIRIAEALDVTPHYLLGWESEQDMEHKKQLNLQFEMYKKRETLLEMKDKGFPDDQIERAIDLFEKYQNATPEVRAAIELLLKQHQ